MYLKIVQQLENTLMSPPTATVSSCLPWAMTQLLCDCVCLSEINGSEQCMWNLIFGFISFKKCLFHKLFEDLLCGQHWIVGETKEIGNRSTNHGSHTQSAAAAKSLQSCPTLCNPIDGSPPCSPIPGILQARTLQWVAISFSNVWKWSRSVVSDPQRSYGLQPSRLLCPWDFLGKSTGVGCHCLLHPVRETTKFALWSKKSTTKVSLLNACVSSAYFSSISFFIIF